MDPMNDDVVPNAYGSGFDIIPGFANGASAVQRHEYKEESPVLVLRQYLTAVSSNTNSRPSGSFHQSPFVVEKDWSCHFDCKQRDLQGFLFLKKPP